MPWNMMQDFGLHYMQDTMPEYLGTANYRISEHFGNITAVTSQTEIDIPTWASPPTTGSPDGSGYLGFSETLRCIFVKANRTNASWELITGWKQINGSTDRIRLASSPSFTVTSSDDFHIFSDSGTRENENATEMSQSNRREGAIDIMNRFKTKAFLYGVETGPIFNGGAQTWTSKVDGSLDAHPNEYTGAIWMWHYERIGERLGFFQANHTEYSVVFRADIGGSEGGATYDPDTLMSALEYNKRLLLNSASAPRQMSCVWLNAQTRSPGSGNTVAQYSGLDEIDAAYARFWCCLAWTMDGTMPQVEIDEGHDLPVLIDEQIISAGAPTSTRNYGTYDPGAIGTPGTFTWRTPNFGTHGYFFEYENCLIAINLRTPDVNTWVPHWLTGGQPTNNSLDLATLPSAGEGNQWEAFNPATYTNQDVNSKFFGKSVADFADAYILGDDSINNGAITTSVLIGPLEARIFIRTPQPSLPPSTGGYTNGWAMQGGYNISQQPSHFSDPWRTLNGEKDLLIYQWRNQTAAQKQTELDALNWFATNHPGLNLIQYLAPDEVYKNSPFSANQHTADLIDGANGNASWWLYNTDNVRVEASHDPTTLWKANASSVTPNNSSGESFAQAFHRIWWEYLDTAPYKRTTMLAGLYHDVCPPYPQGVYVDNGATSSNFDYERDGTATTRYSDAANGGGTLFRSGLVRYVNAFKQNWGPFKAYWGNLTRYGLEYDAGNASMPLTSLETYQKFDGSIIENIGNLINMQQTGTGYSNTGSGNPCPKTFFYRHDIIKSILVPDAQNALGRAVVLTDWTMNNRVFESVDYDAQRTLGALCALCGAALGANKAAGGGPSEPLDEFVYDWGDPVGGAPSMGTLDINNPTKANYQMRAADYVNGAAQFHWQEYENVLWVLRTDWTSQGANTYGSGTAVSCQLPDPGLGNKWAHPDLSAYTNPTTGRSTRNQAPTLNDGSDVAAGGTYGTVALKPAHAVMLVKVPSAIAVRNVPGMLQTSASNTQRDPTHPSYCMPRITFFNIFQPRNLWQPTSRAQWFTDFEAANNTWPYCLHILHQGPFHNTPGFRLNLGEKYGPITDYIQRTTNIDRRDATLGNFYSNEDMFTNSQTGTTNVSKQAGFTVLITHPTTRQQMANIATDALCGTDLSGYGMGSGNVARYMVFMHDGTTVHTPKAGASLRGNFGKGTINTIVSSNSQQPIEVLLDVDYSVPVTGTLAESTGYSGIDPTSYGACDEAHAIWFLPPGDRGFIGFHVIGYKSVGGKAQLFLKQLSSIAHPTQFHTPVAGWRYVFNNQASNLSGYSGDWDFDGVKEDWRAVESWNLRDGIEQYWDLIGAQVSQFEPEVDVGIRVANTISAAHVEKRANGLQVPHAHQQLWDYPHHENAEGDFNFGPVTNGSGSELRIECGNSRIERGMRSIYFGKNFVRPNPGGFANKWARGMVFSIEVPGSVSYASPTDPVDIAIGASCARWYWAVLMASQGNDSILFNIQTENWAPKMIEEQFVDLDTGWAYPAALGTYDESGGGLDPGTGEPYGLWTWSTGATGDLTDNGRRIYIRKLSDDWLVVMNMSDAPTGYDYYIPSHLTGGFTPRDPLDFVEPADWTNLINAGYLPAGMTLTRFNPGTYVNTRVTNDIRTKAPEWLPYSYGPRQSTPFDVNAGSWAYTLSNTPSIIRDNFLNTGAVFDYTQRFSLGPMEAILLRIT